MSMLDRTRRSVFALAALALSAVMVFSALGGAARVAAQEATPTAGAGVSTITVNGVGNVSLSPDTGAITLGVDIFAKTLKEAQAQATSQMNAVISALKKAGIADKDIQTSNYSVSVNQTYDNNGVPGKIAGCTVSNQVTVVVRDLPKLGTILDQAVTAGANSIWGISFYVNDTTDAAKQARTLAVQDAQQHAVELATAAGGKLGAILSITETSSPTPTASDYKGAALGAGGSSTPIQTGSTLVTVTVTITYELIQ
jgi:uncharacterized protein YggE